MNRTLLLVAALFLASPSIAAEQISGRQAVGCFNFLPSDHGIGAEAKINVSLDAEGTPTAIDVIRYQPDTDQGRRLALAAARAVLACGPYPAGTIGDIITMGPDVVYADNPKPIITMPDRADGLDESLGNEIKKLIGQ